jgi:hypothetical protein
MWHDRGEVFDPEVDLGHDALGMVVLQAYEDHLEGMSPRETEIITHRSDTDEWRQCRFITAPHGEQPQKTGRS